MHIINDAGRRNARRLLATTTTAFVLAGAIGVVFLPLSAAMADTAKAAVNVSTNAAITDLKTETVKVVTSPELQQATTSVWKLAWNKIWPPIHDNVAKFFNLFRIAWDALVRLGKTEPTTTADVNTVMEVKTTK